MHIRNRSIYLLIETVRASEELAQGQMASGRKPLLWKALRNESQDVRDPVKEKKKADVDSFRCNQLTIKMKQEMLPFFFFKFFFC